MKRREVIAGLGFVAAWPLTARAQQSALPLVGVLGSGSPDQWVDRCAPSGRTWARRAT